MAAVRSTLSTPTPARPTTFSRPFAASITARVTCACRAASDNALPNKRSQVAPSRLLPREMSACTVIGSWPPSCPVHRVLQLVLTA